MLPLVLAAVVADPPADPFPAAPAAEVWKALPRQDPALPAWAGPLVRPLPKTVAAMLDLDHTQRAKTPLGPALAAKVRWVVFDTLNCGYGRQSAAADLKRAGGTPADLKALDAGPGGWPAADKPLLTFARKLTRAGYTVTDAEVEGLVKSLGAEKTVALAHTVAYANFQTRIIEGLGIKPTDADPPPAAEVTWDRDALAKVPAPARPDWPAALKVTVPEAAFIKPEWEPLTLDEVEGNVGKQQARPGRVPLPDAAAPGGSSRIVWSRVSMGYQPQLTTAWFTAMRTHTAEAKLDAVFENSVFWVVTRTNDCFY